MQWIVHIIDMKMDIIIFVIMMRASGFRDSSIHAQRPRAGCHETSLLS